MLEKIQYGGWPNCYRYTNNSIEVVLTADVGPRIVYLGFVGQENIFNTNLGDLGSMGGIAWHHYGGHRLWHGPEVKPRTYYPDNWPIQVVVEGHQVRLIQPVEETTAALRSGRFWRHHHSRCRRANAGLCRSRATWVTGRNGRCAG